VYERPVVLPRRVSSIKVFLRREGERGAVRHMLCSDLIEFGLLWSAGLSCQVSRIARPRVDGSDMLSYLLSQHFACISVYVVSLSKIFASRKHYSRDHGPVSCLLAINPVQLRFVKAHQCDPIVVDRARNKFPLQERHLMLVCNSTSLCPFDSLHAMFNPAQAQCRYRHEVSAISPAVAAYWLPNFCL
jgi:hypothetical protein